jgi:hypothetical protein
MSHKMPLFVAAPRCIIQVGGQRIAYAVGLSLNVSCAVEPVKVLGKYSIESIEPLMVNPTTGTFRIVRLISQTSRQNARNVVRADTARESVATNFLTDTDIAGADSTVSADSGQSTVLSQTALYRHLDPWALILSQSFDILLQLRVPVVNQGNFGSDGFLSAGNYTIQPTNFMQIKDARLTSGSANLAPAQIFQEVFSFEGLLAVSHWDTNGNAVQQLDTTWKESPAGV